MTAAAMTAAAGTMTDGAGRTARWTAAALAAPVVAGGFAGVTAWALHHDPRQQSAAASQVASAPVTPSEDQALAALGSKLAANTRTIDRLYRQVAAVRAQAAALAKGGRASTSAGSAARSSATSARAGSTSSTRSQASVPAPAPPPTTHTTTGASGSKK
jgi:hypothetical protein